MNLRNTLAMSLALIAATASVASAQVDPSQNGSYLVRSVDVTANLQGSSANLEVILPAAPSFARPVVIVLHGWLAPTTLYEGIAHHLASRGFAAVLFEQPDFYSSDMQSWTNNTMDAITALGKYNNDPSCAFFGELDMTKVGVIGHSRGGATSTMIAGQDPRVKCAVALAPADFWSQQSYQNMVDSAARITAPYLAIIGASDTWLATPVVPQQFYDVAKHAAEREFIEVTGGGHMMYFGGGSNDVLSSRYYTAWLERFLMGKADPQGFTTGVMGQAQLQQGVLTVADHAVASGASATPPPAPSSSSTGSTTTTTTTSSSGNLQQGSSGAAVTALQQKLQALGFYSGAIDGDFGPQTQAAVIAYQKSQGLTADGIVGPKTKAALGL
jgi:dienelactone hydrolase